MQKTIDVNDLQHHLGEVLGEVVQQQVAYVLARGSDPEAVVIPYDQFLRYRKLDEERPVEDRFDEMLARLDALNANYTDEEVAADVAAAIAAVRARKRR